MSTLDSAQLGELAGGPVASLEDAASAEEVTAEDVAAAAKLAAEAEQIATATEQAAIAGTVPEDRAISTREAARFASLRHALQERRHARHLAAQRLRALEAVGRDALSLAGRLKGLRDATVADLAEVEQLLTGVQDRINEWNAELAAVAARGAGLGPEPVPPSGIPVASSAGVWAGEVDRGPRVIVKRRVIRYIDAEDPHNDGWAAMIDAAVTETAGPGSAQRFILLPGGTVTTLGADPGGHVAAQIAAGTVHELSPRQRRDYLAGHEINWSNID